MSNWADPSASNAGAYEVLDLGGNNSASSTKSFEPGFIYELQFILSWSSVSSRPVLEFYSDINSNWLTSNGNYRVSEIQPSFSNTSVSRSNIELHSQSLGLGKGTGKAFIYNAGDTSIFTTVHNSSVDLYGTGSSAISNYKGVSVVTTADLNEFFRVRMLSGNFDSGSKIYVNRLKAA